MPAGYTLNSPVVHCGDSETCVGAPLRVSVQCSTASGSAVLGFYASEAFIERVRTSYFPHKDYELDKQTKIRMLRYRNAAEYCDLRASLVSKDAVLYRDEDTSFYNERLAEHRREYENEVTAGMQGLKIKMLWTDVTAAHRVYTFDYGGTTVALCIMAEVRAYKSDAGGEVSIVWFVPEYYYLLCPLSMYEQIHNTDFKVFIESTAVSDTFIQLEDQLTANLSKEIIDNWASQIAASNAYVAAMNAFMERSVNDYLYSSSYSSSSRFSDYIFDRYEYTTSSGYSVSISTGYDYVWESSDGSIGFSTSAFDMPSGSTMLTPTR